MSPAQRHELWPADSGGNSGPHETRRVPRRALLRRRSGSGQRSNPLRAAGLSLTWDRLTPGERMKSQSQRRQSAPSLVLTKALTRSRTVSRESFQAPVCPETCLLIQAFLACPDRSFLLHGHAQLKTGLQTQERDLFLFSDTLLITKAKAVNHFKQKAQVRLSEVWVGGSMEEVCEGSTAPDRGFVMGWPTCNCVATFSSSEQKEKWLSLLKSRIKEEKEREEPKTIALTVHAKGVSAFAHTKTLPVSNSDSTNEVIRLALQQFGVAGSVKDYQMWVISKRDNTPYPLIGHEFPFSIHVHHMRAAPRRDALASCDQQGALQPEPPPGGKQCRFVLKPRPATPAQGQGPAQESSQKHFKRRRSLINWAFWRGSTPQLNDPACSSNSGHHGNGCLFGQPLSSLCLEDKLPRPIMDMLFFLYHEGSWTRGIFRRSAGARAVRELRDSLDAGLSDLPLTRDHVFIIAGVFKDFLRNIPGSLLSSALYEEWAEVVEEEEKEAGEQEQVQDTQRLIGRLPAANQVLLRYVVVLLHGIQGNARHNQMTSFNLSVCIAPSMLWAPGPSTPEQEGRGAKMVCDLVRFMIDHCQQILGQEPSAVFGGPPQRCGDEDTPSAAESWSCPLTDSSYDSLENELDDTSSGGSPSLARHHPLRRHRNHRHHGNPLLQGSLDSILTLSDPEPDGGPEPVGDPGGPAAGSGSGGAGAAPARLPLPDPWSPGHGQRRCSEPAVAYTAKWAACDASEEGRCGSGEDKPPGAVAGLPAPQALPRSPLQTLCDWAAQRPRAPERGRCPRGGAHREPLSWGTLKGTSRGLHPNSWLKKTRRLPGEGEGLAATTPAHHHSTGSLHFPSTAAGPAPSAGSASSSLPPPPPPHPPGSQPGATLSLFRRQRSSQAVAVETTTPLAERRRSSEPGLPRLHREEVRGPAGDPGLRVSRVDPEAVGETGEPQSDQQGALALVRGRGQWRRRRRHSSAVAERDFNQLLFSEESYV
ncbi:Rho GTPase-activating protein 20 [Merluccius polli]|uniref:Rho GTPase-activating protein 20 n=1 Tax=Merluccius polli TaxID=89951 RepID=A0AA47MHK3_MERPO|nr:Rho GTPase-activating protein 20 [Merluccius polli]